MDSEDEFEDVLVYMDFNTKINENFFTSDEKFKIIGLEEDKPIAQLGSQVFEGEWKDTLGTYLLFEESNEDPQAGDVDPLFSENIDKTMRFSMKTDKLLYMSRVFLKINPESETLNESQKSNDQSLEN